MTTTGLCQAVFWASTSDPPQVRGATILFVAVTLLLGIFLVAVALTIASRRRRPRHSTEQNVEHAVGDAWAEAGRRAHPFDEGSSDED